MAISAILHGHTPSGTAVDACQVFHSSMAHMLFITITMAGYFLKQWVLYLPQTEVNKSRLQSIFSAGMTIVTGRFYKL